MATLLSIIIPPASCPLYAQPSALHNHTHMPTVVAPIMYSKAVALATSSQIQTIPHSTRGQTGSIPRFFSRYLFQLSSSLHYSPFSRCFNISPRISFPYLLPFHQYTLSLPVNSVAMINPDTPLSTTSWVLTPPSHFTCPTRQSNCSTPSPTTFSLTPTFSFDSQTSFYSSPPHKNLCLSDLSTQLPS